MDDGSVAPDNFLFSVFCFFLFRCICFETRARERESAAADALLESCSRALDLLLHLSKNRADLMSPFANAMGDLVLGEAGALLRRRFGGGGVWGRAKRLLNLPKSVFVKRRLVFVFVVLRSRNSPGRLT